jgi:hypothetical protein
MFITTQVRALFKRGALKLITDGDGQITRVAECQCVIEPFPVALASELGEEVAAHLFDDAGHVRDEIAEVKLRVRVPMQSIEVSSHEELMPVTIGGVGVKDLGAKRCEDPKAGRSWLEFSFVLVIPLESTTARNFVIDSFGSLLYWSFTPMQRDLFLSTVGAELHEAAARATT